MEKCVVCSRKKSSPSEGRYIDGSWRDDYKIPEKFQNKWVCSYRCYEKLLGKDNTCPNCGAKSVEIVRCMDCLNYFCVECEDEHKRNCPERDW